jgi:predicted butyrate kinase (DUF1464 family)
MSAVPNQVDIISDNRMRMMRLYNENMRLISQIRQIQSVSSGISKERKVRQITEMKEQIEMNVNIMKMIASTLGRRDIVSGRATQSQFMVDDAANILETVISEDASGKRKSKAKSKRKYKRKSKGRGTRRGRAKK